MIRLLSFFLLAPAAHATCSGVLDGKVLLRASPAIAALAADHPSARFRFDWLERGAKLTGPHLLTSESGPGAARWPRLPIETFRAGGRLVVQMLAKPAQH